MISFSRVDADELAAVYVVANTARFLYRHLRRHPTVERLAREVSSEELVRFIRLVDGSADRPLTHVAQAYAAVTALALQDSKDVEAALTGVEFANLAWADAIIDMGRQQRIGLTRTTLKVPKIVHPDEMRRERTVGLARTTMKVPKIGHPGRPPVQAGGSQDIRIIVPGTELDA